MEKATSVRKMFEMVESGQTIIIKSSSDGPMNGMTMAYFKSEGTKGKVTMTTSDEIVELDIVQFARWIIKFVEVNGFEIHIGVWEKK